MKKIITILLVLTMIFSLMGCSGKKKDYDAAVEAYNNGDYVTALEDFNKIADYEDSADYIVKCQEGITDTYLDNMNYAGLAEISESWDDQTKADLLEKVYAATEDYLGDYYSFDPADFSTVVDLEGLMVDWGDFDSKYVTILNMIIKDQDIFTKWDNTYFMLYDYHDEVLDKFDEIDTYIDDSDFDKILTAVTELQTIADEIEADYGTDDELIVTYTAAVRDYATNLENEVNNVSDTDTSTAYYNQRMAALDQLNSIIDGYNDEYATAIDEIIEYYQNNF